MGTSREHHRKSSADLKDEQQLQRVVREIQDCERETRASEMSLVLLP